MNWKRKKYVLAAESTSSWASGEDFFYFRFPSGELRQNERAGAAKKEKKNFYTREDSAPF